MGRQQRRLIFIIFILTVGMTRAVYPSLTQGQDSTPPATTFPTDSAAPQPGQYLGSPSCASGNCHGSVQPRDLYDVKQNEYFIWLKQDRHTQAYNVLLTKKSARIARNMKMKKKAFESDLCLDCHALNAPQSAQARPIDMAEGISCEACHGPAGGWIDKHTEEGWTHEKSVEAGMKDLRNLASRATTCLSCHLGDSTKTVNHELRRLN